MTISKRPNSNLAFKPLHLILLCVLFSVSISTKAQWAYISTPSGLGLSMKVLNEDTLFCSNDDAGDVIYRSINGGETWTDFQLNLETEDVTICDYSFPTSQVGYACGYASFQDNTGVILKTENSGLTWDTVSTTLNINSSRTDVEFINVDTGFVSKGHDVLKTTDGGITFISLDNILDFGSPSIFKLTSNGDGVIFITSENTIYGSTNHSFFSIYRSADLGNSWQEVYVNIQSINANSNHYLIKDMHFPTSTHGYAVGGNGRFLKTADAGLTWSESFTGSNFSLSAVFFTSVDVGYINDDFKIFKTTDGGNTWVDQNSITPNVLDIQFASDSVGYASKISSLAKTTNGGETPLALTNIDLSKTLVVYPNPTKDAALITFDEGQIKTIEIVNLSGQIVMPVSECNGSINLTDIAAGIYFLNINTSKGLVNKKLLVQ